METDMLELLKQQSKVTRSNALARSRHQLGLLQNRVMYLLFAEISRGDEQLLVQQIPIADIRAKLRGSYGSFYTELREAVSDLVGQRLFIEKDNGGWKVLSWVTSAEYVRAGEKGNPHDYLEIKLHEDLTPHLLQLREKYNSIPLEALLSLASTNSQRLIDILWHDSFAGERRELTYEIEDLKTRMNLEGKYPRFRDFSRALDYIQQEFLERTPLRFKYRGSKVGRSWSHVHFEVWSVSAEAVTVLADDPDAERKERLRLRLQQAGYTQDIDVALAKYELDELDRVLEVAYSAHKRAAHTVRPIRNLGGLIHKLLTDGVGKKADTTPDEASGFDAETVAAQIFEAYLGERSEVAEKRSLELSAEDRQMVIDHIKLSAHPFVLERLAKDGWAGKLMRKHAQDGMIALGLLKFSAALRSPEAFARQHSLLKASPEAEQVQVVQAVRALDEKA